MVELAQELEEVAATDELHDEVDFGFILEYVPGANHELVIGLRQYALLEEAGLYHFLVNDDIFVDGLHG